MSITHIRKIELGAPRKLVKKVGGDVFGGPLTDSERQDSLGNEPVAARITVDTNPMRITTDGTTPEQAGNVGHVLSEGMTPTILTSTKEIIELRWINKTGAASGNLQITLFY